MNFIIYAILTQRARAENLKKSICHFLTNRKCIATRYTNSKREKRLNTDKLQNIIHSAVHKTQSAAYVQNND